MENILRKARRQTHIQSRPYVLYQWLAILQRLHPLYKDDPKLPSANADSFSQLFRQFCSAIKKCNRTIMENAITVTDASAINAENLLGDDVAQVRDGLLDP